MTARWPRHDAARLRVAATTVLMTAALSLPVGCASREDRAFEDAVHPVLRMAVDVVTSVPTATGELEPLREKLASLRAAEAALPAPKRKGLRYLAIRLSVSELSLAYWVGARETEQAWRDHTDPRWRADSKAEADASLKYLSNLRLLGSAERVVLGTSDIRDRITEFGDDTLRTLSPDEVRGVESEERFVREQIAALR